jgi:very-short-patch-repair endonuclease
MLLVLAGVVVAAYKGARSTAKPRRPRKRAPAFKSPMEDLFWAACQRANKRASAAMVRQYPVGRYRLDFAFPDVKLGVEIDGHDYHHASKEQVRRDYERQRRLMAQGWTILRYTGSEVYRGADACAAEVMQTRRGMKRRVP